jgi:hypothetical protein
MEEFYIDIQLSQGSTRIQVDEIPSEQWDIPFIPQFIIEYYTGSEFITLTIQLEHGLWYDRNTRITEDNYYQRFFELGPDAWNPDYHSPLCTDALQEIGAAISRHMVIYLTTYLGLLTPCFPKPALN